MFKWKNGEVPKNLEVKQVYGVVFTQDGRTLLRNEKRNGKEYYSLAGGRPENFDKNKEATLRREFIEEVNTTLKNPVMLGYQIVNEKNDTPIYAQVRMTALIDEIGVVKPDPDNGKTYNRLLTTPKKAIKLLNWGNVGKKMMKSAVKIAKKEFGIKKFIDHDEFV